MHVESFLSYFWRWVRVQEYDAANPTSVQTPIGGNTKKIC